MSLPEWLANLTRDAQESFRLKRMRRFARAFPLAAGTRILDVGGTPDIWSLLPEARSVVMVNMPRADESRQSAAAGFAWVHGDGGHLPFADGSFDVVFSNSVIEHVGGPEAQRRFASEVMRTGRGFWVQTPNRYFPVEMHLLTPFVHLLPGALRASIVRRFTIWQWIHRPAPDAKRFYIEHFISDIRLLTAGQLQELFPGAVIIRERFLLFTKSLIAYRPVPTADPYRPSRS